MPSVRMHRRPRATGAQAEPVSRALRPVDAATLILLRGENGRDEVLMGRRSARHAFMPSVYVFPGGRVDRGDGALPHRGELRDRERLLAGMGSRPSARRGRALALAALRETLEETGLAPLGTTPDLRALRYVARAITPPGRTRRFDTRFFALRVGGGGEPAGEATDELEDLRWVPLRATDGLPLATITGLILDDLRERLASDPDLSGAPPLPFYRARHGTVVRETF